VEASKPGKEEAKKKAPSKEENKTINSKNSIQKPALKKEIVLKALDELEDDLIRSIKDKLGGNYSDDEIRSVYSSIVKRK
jgi:ATP-dependent DNA helicase RecQ